MTKDELIELAREGMEMHSPKAPEYIVCAALIEALAQPEQEKIENSVRQAIDEFGKERFARSVVEPEQEPVAWRYRMPVEDGHWVWNYATYIDDPKDQRCEPLYITPPQRKPLTDEQWQVIADTLDCLITRKQKDAIEAVIGIKE